MVRSFKFLPVLLVLSFITKIHFSSSDGETNMFCSPREKHALLTFNQGLTDPSHRLSSWVGDNCCIWEGVGCKNRTGSVVRLDLKNTYSDIYYDDYTTDLESLSLGGNKLLSGSLPRQLGNLINLDHLDQSGSSFSGPIPMSLGRLKSLRELYLNDNNFNSSLPDSLGNLSNLQELSISNNSLEGVICETHFANLTRLKYLYAPTNSLALNVSSAWIPKFQLIELNLNSWKLGPEFPARLHTQNSISYLGLSNASISDSIPTWFWNIYSRLDVLDLSNNQIKGDLENALPRLTSNIEELDLSNNYFSGNISFFLCNPLDDRYQLLGLGRRNSQLLDAFDVFKVGEIPEKIGVMVLLENLDLSKNQLTGIIPQSISRLTSLNQLNLSYNNLSGEIPTGPQLQTFTESSYVSNNGLCGTPLLKKCNGNGFGGTPTIEDQDSDVYDMTEQFYVTVGPGFVVGLASFCEGLVFMDKWRIAYFRFMEDMKDKLLARF
ncbi:hypothetical protein GIB67_023579 [Kingdonia uniflora]|uniref:Leucine-rich repeat-containing N-terminal plant-type domain-containing protein n=1 Tax=Kingdonia uniflora TaxID=39325 RepID=A0A7J7PAT3_9MAGN|nr:hypothetical protein GIB67_023579 [Kingdonia uniflora]